MDNQKKTKNNDVKTIIISCLALFATCFVIALAYTKSEANKHAEIASSRRPAVTKVKSITHTSTGSQPVAVTDVPVVTDATTNPETAASIPYFIEENIKHKVIEGIFDPYLYCYIEVPEEALYDLNAEALRKFYSKVPEESEYFMIITGSKGIFVSKPSEKCKNEDTLTMMYGKLYADDNLSMEHIYATILLKSDCFEVINMEKDCHFECESLNQDILNRLKEY